MMNDAPRAIRMISFAGDGVFSPVLDSQIVVPLAVMGKAAPHVRRALLVLTSSRHRNRPDLDAREKEIRGALPGVNVFFRHRPFGGVPFEPRIWAGRLREAIAECGYSGPEPIVVHCRGQVAASAAAIVKRRDPRIRVLLDVRGAQTDELSGGGLWYRYLRWCSDRTLRSAFDGADAINTVSARLVEHLREAGLLSREMPRSVVGCCADTERFYFDPLERERRRRELGFEGRFVITYCGSLVAYQRPDAIADAFAAIRADMPEAHFFAITRDARPLIDLLAARGVGSEYVTARSAAHDQVASCLMAGDVGLLLREDTLTNRVASPVKFAEYLRCGLPVIITRYVGDFADLAVGEGVGQAVDFPVDAVEIAQAAHMLRARLEHAGDAYRTMCSSLAGKRLSWHGQIEHLLRLYCIIAGSVPPADAPAIS